MQAQDELGQELLKERNQEFRKLSEQLEEVSEIFQIMKNEVHTQGEKLDDIHDHIEKAEIETENATEQLRKADKNKQESLFVTAAIFTSGLVLSTLSLAILFKR